MSRLLQMVPKVMLGAGVGMAVKGAVDIFAFKVARPNLVGRALFLDKIPGYSDEWQEWEWMVLFGPAAVVGSIVVGAYVTKSSPFDLSKRGLPVILGGVGAGIALAALVHIVYYDVAVEPQMFGKQLKLESGSQEWLVIGGGVAALALVLYFVLNRRKKRGKGGDGDSEKVEVHIHNHPA